MIGWIEVKREMPPDCEDVLIYWGEPSIPLSIGYASRDGDGHDRWCDAFTHDEAHGDPTHWMPLPPLPLEGERPNDEADEAAA